MTFASFLSFFFIFGTISTNLSLAKRVKCPVYAGKKVFERNYAVIAAARGATVLREVMRITFSRRFLG